MKVELFAECEVELAPCTAQWCKAHKLPSNQSGLKEFFWKKVHPGARVVDVGASVGSFSLPHILHDGTEGLAIEPIPGVAACLRENLTLNGLGSCVRVCQMALADYDGTAVIARPADPIGSGGSTLGDPSWKGERVLIPVEVRKLDSLIREADFIKLDVEGAEFLVLQGAEGVIERSHPSILFENSHKNCAQFDHGVNAAPSWLEGRGYTLDRSIHPRNIWAVYDD
jgi:FkbM family methyltransferase